jgi:hypothetical protein
MLVVNEINGTDFVRMPQDLIYKLPDGKFMLLVNSPSTFNSVRDELRTFINKLQDNDNITDETRCFSENCDLPEIFQVVQLIPSKCS